MTLGVIFRLIESLRPAGKRPVYSFQRGFRTKNDEGV